MKALVAGVGAIGGWLFARLAEGGADVTGLTRGETYARLSAGEPFVLDSYERSWSGRVRVIDKPDHPYDYTFICSKSQDTPDIGRALVPGDGIVVSVQNGVENADVLREWHKRVVPSVVYSGTRRTSAVEVQHTGAGQLMLDAHDPDAIEVADYLEAHGVEVKRVPDIRVALWRKLLGNALINPLCAITGLEARLAFSPEAMGPVVLAGTREVVAVGRAEGVALAEDEADRAADGYKRLPSNIIPSTLQDMRAHKPLEVDALTGVVVRLADKHGIPVPVMRTFDALLRAIDPARADT